MEARPKRLFFSFRRMWTIAENTMTEVIRQKFFYILLIFAVVVLVSSVFFSGFSSVEMDRIKFIKDFSLGAIKIFGVVIAMVGTAQLLPLELENRTIYPILAKPVFRVEFLIGKYLGMISLLFLTVMLMGVIFGGLLFYTEHQLAAEAAAGQGQAFGVTPQEAVQQIYKQTRDPNLLKAIGLIYVQFVMVSAISLLIATFATSVIFNVICTVIIYICGHLEGVARQSWLGDPSPLAKTMLLVITFFVPDLDAFNVVDAVVIGQGVPMDLVVKTIGYGVFYSAVVLLVAYLIFEEKEI